MTDHDPMTAIDDTTTPRPAGDTPTLQEVTRAALRAQQAQQDLTQAATRAREAGDNISAIAEAAGVTRQTIYRWTSQAGMGTEPGAPLPVRETLDQGLAILMAHGNAHAARYLGGRGTIVGAIAAWETGLKDLQMSRLDEEERAVLSQVSLVVGLAKTGHARTGQWPQAVRF